MISWTVAAPAIGAAFAASLVEAVEAFTIVLAVGVLRGWRTTLIGSIAGVGVLALLILFLGPILNRMSLHVLQLTVLLLFFGMGWLRKAILRYAGLIPLHDEQAAFVAETTNLQEAT